MGITAGRRQAGTLVVAAALALAAACGDDGDADVKDDPPPTTASTAGPPSTEPSAPGAAVAAGPTGIDGYEWSEIADDAPWTGRAGLRVVVDDDRFVLLGGRTPNPSTIPGDSRIWGDVWVSDDRGASWTRVLEGGADSWAPRAYFQAVGKDGDIFVLGGQDFGLEPNPFCALLEQGLEPPPGLGIDPDAPCPELVPTSQFFNDVWRSPDGVEWEQMTAAAPWAGRAGLSAAVLGDHIYVLGGSQNDDESIIGPDGPQRIYFNDVWRSRNGIEWEEMTSAAPWAPRAGSVVLVVDEQLLLLGGEDGFTCEPLPDCDAPYFNDVWRSSDGATWELVTESAGWSPRPGHACELVDDRENRHILCFGGFGLVENPVDMWASVDGVEWRRLDASPWNASEPEAVRYDFESLVAPRPDGTDVVYTFGGDRETFDFDDPENHLRIDDDVWAFASAG